MVVLICSCFNIFHQFCLSVLVLNKISLFFWSICLQYLQISKKDKSVIYKVSAAVSFRLLEHLISPFKVWTVPVLNLKSCWFESPCSKHTSADEICSLRALPRGYTMIDFINEFCLNIGLVSTFVQVPNNCWVDFHEVHAWHFPTLWHDLWPWTHCS